MAADGDSPMHELLRRRLDMVPNRRRGPRSDAITRVALRHRPVSGCTSFVAVNSSRRTEGSHGVTVHQAVPIPESARYDTTVQKRSEDPHSAD